MESNNKYFRKLPDGTALISANGLIRLSGKWAYEGNKKERKKPKAFLNLIFNFARQNGYEKETSLRSHYKNRVNDFKTEDALIDELLAYVSNGEIESALSYIRQI